MNDLSRGRTGNLNPAFRATGMQEQREHERLESSLLRLKRNAPRPELLRTWAPLKLSQLELGRRILEGRRSPN